MTNINKNQLSKEISKKFQLLDNSLKRSVKQNPKDLIEIELGDTKQPDFKPQFKIMRWNNEVNFSMRAKEHPDAVVEVEGEVVKYKTPDYEVHQYEKPEAGEDGGFEFEWILPSKPNSNILEATIQTKELDFFYQPPLTQAEIDQGNIRPDNVVGSYAVYHKSKRDNWNGGKEYKTGKAFHIFRPKAIDLNGLEVWCSLEVDRENGLLRVIVPQEYLNRAQYPVKVDPTFGYTSQGASDLALSSGSFDGKMAQRGDSIAGSLEKISAYLKITSAGSANYQLQLLDNSGSNKPNTSLVISSSQAITDTTYVLKEQSLSYSMTSGTYWVSGNGLKTGFPANRGAYDTGGTTNYGATFTDDVGTWSLDSNRYSVYATYTAATNYTRSVSENVKIAESASKVLAFSRNKADAITAAESLKRQTDTARFQSDSSSIADSSKITVQINRGNFEGIGIQDVATRLQTASRANSDIATIADSVEAGRVLLLFLQDMQVISDVLGAEIVIGINTDGEDPPVIESVFINTPTILEIE